MLWALLHTTMPEWVAPTTTIMRMVFLFAGGQLCGYIVQWVRLPDMLGMIFWGIFYTNMGFGNFEGYDLLEAKLRYVYLIR